MCGKSPTLKKAFHVFVVYLPVILIFSLIIMIYLTYVFTYVLVLINTSPEETISTYVFGNTLNPVRAHTKGVWLFVITLILVLMLLLCFFRTIFMDPGYFPSPIELENKIVRKNLPISKKDKKQLKNYQDDIEMSLNATAAEGSYTDEAKRRIEFLSIYHKYFSNGPLTVSETNALREQIATIFPHPREEAIICSQSIEDVLDKNKKSYMDKYEAEFKKSTCCYTSKNIPPAETVFLTIHSGIDLTKLNLCGNCLRFKVERSHHCRQCGKCILKMDHHCPWLANCIGFKNYKSFCLLHLYGVLSTLLISLSYWEVVLNYNLNYDTSLFMVLYVTFVYFCNIGLMMFLFWLLIVNCGLVFSGLTIIEQAEKERFPSKSTNIYDLGWQRNFVNVFGSNPLVWFIPFFANLKGKGLLFETNDFLLVN
jgi:hypothetical protein